MLGRVEDVDIVFDGPPSHESGRFVEVENSEGKSINFGEWVQRADGYWVLRFKAALSSSAPCSCAAELERVREAVNRKDDLLARCRAWFMPGDRAEPLIASLDAELRRRAGSAG